MTEYWCEYAWLGGAEVARSVTLDVRDDRLVSVTPDTVAAPDAVRLNGLTMPALANAHSHAFHRALRGRTHSGRGTFWDWREVMYQVAGRLDPDNYFELARATFGEMVLAGIGVVGEFHYVHHRLDGSPYEDPNAMGAALVAAATEAGIRITLLDTAYLHGGFGDDPDAASPYVPLRPEQVRFGDGSAQRWQDRVEQLRLSASGPMSKVGAAIHSVRAVDPEAMRTVAAWAQSHNSALHVHVSEQPAENEQCMTAHQCTPIELLGASGALGAMTTLVHATHLTDTDVTAIATSTSGCCFCPTTERDLADGIGQSGALAAAGVGLSLGSDSHAVIDLFEEARAVELNERLATLQRGTHRADQLATMATAQGYRSLDWHDGGQLHAGALADFCTISLDSAALSGTDPALALAAVIFSAAPTDVHSVVVAGHQVVSHGKHYAMDVPTELAKAIQKVTTP